MRQILRIVIFLNIFLICLLLHVFFLFAKMNTLSTVFFSEAQLWGESLGIPRPVPFPLPDGDDILECQILTNMSI